MHSDTLQSLLSRRSLVAALLAASLSVACGPSVQVSTDTAPRADFSKYKTFAMNEPNKAVVNTSVDVSPFVMQRLRQLAYERMLRMGFAVAEKEKADFLVHVAAATSQRVEVYNSGMYGRDPFYGPVGGNDIENVTEGTLVIDIVDRAHQSVIWRGTGKRDLGGRPDDAELALIVNAVLDAYPAPLVPLAAQQAGGQPTPEPAEPPAPAESTAPAEPPAPAAETHQQTSDPNEGSVKPEGTR